MGVEDVDILETQAAQTLIEAGQQVLARPELAVGTRPHVISGLGRDDQLVAEGTEVLGKHTTKVDLGASVGRSVVVGEIKMRDPEVEGAP